MVAFSEKVKVTFECTPDERAYIKMLAARAHTTISSFLLSYLKKDFPGQPNAETHEALMDSRNKKNLGSAKNVSEFWKQMGIEPHA